MNALILTPTDTLMLRDARPMEGTLAGHTQDWPTPDLVAHALRAALHRSKLDSHMHQYHPRGQVRITDGDVSRRTAAYGSLLHAGPFPVSDKGGQETWHFPCPLDIEQKTLTPTCLPAQAGVNGTLPAPLKYCVISLKAPSKENKAPRWITADGWQQYMHASGSAQEVPVPDSVAVTTGEVVDTEHSYGIELNDRKRSVKDGSFYSCSYLRMKPGWHIGSFTSSAEKWGKGERRDVVQELIDSSNGTSTIVVGGQQRICTAVQRPAADFPLVPAPIPAPDADGKVRIKWVLLTPAIWSRHGQHPGGWLPTWVDCNTGQVLLQGGDRTRREREPRAEWRKRLMQSCSPIDARLVAAVVGKPQVISGYATEGRLDGAEGPKSTHSAAPAGSVYYFECASSAAAEQLCAALNCVSTPELTRRSELLGEQGFGLGMCAPWRFASSLT